MGEDPQETKEESTAFLVLRTAIYSVVAAAPAPLISGRVLEASRRFEEINIDLPLATIWSIQLAGHGLIIGLAIFFIAFCILALVGAGTRSRAARIKSVIIALTLGAGLAACMVWASELPLFHLSAALESQQAAPISSATSAGGSRGEQSEEEKR